MTPTSDISNQPQSKRAAQKERTHHRLLDSALELFAERDYRDVSIEALASRAGVSRVGFYLHFASLGALARELVSPVLLELSEQYGKLDHLALEEQPLREWSRDLLQLWHDNGARIRLGEYVVAVDPGLRDLWASGMDDVCSLMPRYLAAWTAASQRPMGILRLTAMLLEHERLCYLIVSSANEHDEESLVELLMEQAWVLLARRASTGVPAFGTPSGGERPSTSRLRTSKPSTSNPSTSEPSTSKLSTSESRRP